MIIYGAGVIGCEYACIFRELGCDVAIYDARNEVLANLDREITGQLRKIMEDNGIKFCMNKSLTHVTTDGPTAIATFGSDVVKTDVLFFAAGRVSSTKGMGLDRIGIKVSDRGVIAVDENFETSVRGIYAAGDAIGPPALAATSSIQGRHAACHAFASLQHPFPKI